MNFLFLHGSGRPKCSWLHINFSATDFWGFWNTSSFFSSCLSLQASSIPKFRILNINLKLILIFVLFSLSFPLSYVLFFIMTFPPLIYSTSNASPISWQVDGPRTLYHDFSASLCEINLRMIIFNSSDAVASVHVKTFDSINTGGHLSEGTSSPSGNQSGWYWHDASVEKDIKVTSDVLGARGRKSLSLESVTPFVWSGTSSTSIQIQPMSKTEIPLQICVFSAGIYDLSNYVLQWNLLSTEGPESLEGTRQSSGTCQGYQYYLSVLQSS